MDDDICEAALCRAKATGRRLGSVLSEMARHALRPDTQPMRDPEKGARFRSFDTPPDIPLIPASRVQEVLDDNGIV